MAINLSYFDTSNVTSGEYLYRSLGSFWTSLFSEKKTLAGYTRGQAEEITQRYYDLIEVVNSFSTTDIPVFHKEKWAPVYIYKSKLNKEKFVFEQGEAIFGEQPPSSKFYSGVTFQFGKDKEPVSEVFTYEVGKDLVYSGVLANRVISPDTVLVSGVDYYVEAGVLRLNADPFANPKLTKTPLVSENGEPVTFTNQEGDVVVDELIILWGYHAETDRDILLKNYGYIFDIAAPSSENYKELLKAIAKLYVNGPTVLDLVSCVAAFLDTPVVTYDEVVEELIDDGSFKYVVTDKSVYKLNINYNLKPVIEPGYQLTPGDILSDNLAYYDNSDRFPGKFYGGENYTFGWWGSDDITGSSLALSKHLFNGSYEQQLTFSTELDLISLNSDGNLVFPVQGTPKDVATFHSYINKTSRKEKIKTVLGLVNPGDSYATIPLTFVMENFLKANSGLFAITFLSASQQAIVMALLADIKKLLPPYCYFIYKIALTFPFDEFSNLNNSITITFDSGTQTLNADGSNEDGMIEELAPYGYKSVKDRLFEVSRQIKKSSTEDLPHDYITTDQGELDGDTVTEGRFMLIGEGQLIQTIVAGKSTREYPTLSFLAFS